MSGSKTKSPSAAQSASDLLGLYKAEWLNGSLFDLFTEPGYIPELTTKRPCMLIGGRGTGKTTVLRGLSYEGQFAFGSKNPKCIQSWSYIGLYHRVNTNRVTAFRGPELSEEKWAPLFGHYINLNLCGLMLAFARWYEVHTGEAIEAMQAELDRFGRTLGIYGLDNLNDAREKIENLLVEFEAAVNSIADARPSKLSLQGAPLDALSGALISAPQLAGKQFFFLIDEFENYQDYQQRVLNTFIKHSTTNYTFKVGVRELGWRQRATLNPSEQLTSPADYAQVSISNLMTADKFREFAQTVVSKRLQLALGTNRRTADPSFLFPGLSEQEEADLLLDASEKNKLSQVAASINITSTAVDRRFISVPYLHFLKTWSDQYKDEDFSAALPEFIKGTAKWKDRINNHFYAYLFTLRKGKSGLRKYYCGWDTLLSLAHGNIRYLLELVHATYQLHIADGGTDDQPISQEHQTQAAQTIGRKNLSELEGLTVHGAQLTKLLLSLGRVFQVLAEEPLGHAPEVNQFYLKDDVSRTSEMVDVTELLTQAVMHLALVRFPGSKLISEGDTRAYDYMIHPIFAAFFGFSHRKKRKLLLSPHQITELVRQPKEAIKAVLSQNNRDMPETLPDQLTLFDSFYAKS